MKKILMLLFVISFAAALAQPAKAAQTVDDNRWHFTIEPYLPCTMMDGYSAVSGIKTNVSFGLDNLLGTLDEVQVILGGRFEVSKGKFALLYDGNYLQVRDEVNKSASGLPLDVAAEVKVRSGLQELAVAYQIGKWNTSGTQDKPLTVDLIVGARHVYLRADINTTTTVDLPIIGSLIKSGSQSATKSWVNPFIGGRLSFPLRDRLILNFRTDVGGFGVSSDFTWNAIIEARYYFTDNKNAFMASGFRGYGDYYNEKDFKYHIVTYGPVVSVGFRF